MNSVYFGKFTNPTLIDAEGKQQDISNDLKQNVGLILQGNSEIDGYPKDMFVLQVPTLQKRNHVTRQLLPFPEVDVFVYQPGTQEEKFHTIVDFSKGLAKISDNGLFGIAEAIHGCNTGVSNSFGDHLSTYKDATSKLKASRVAAESAERNEPIILQQEDAPWKRVIKEILDRAVPVEDILPPKEEERLERVVEIERAAVISGVQGVASQIIEDAGTARKHAEESDILGEKNGKTLMVKGGWV